MSDVITNENVKTLVDALGISKVFAEVLVGRGIDTPEKAEAFLHPSKEMITDPLLLSGMQDAVRRIREAIEKKERIVIYGDYDCDGILATSILYDYFLSLDADVYYHIPNRFEDGYGLKTETLESIAENLFPDLIITVDCGISAVEEAEYLSEVLAIDLIITDHHTLPDILPNVIVIDPKQDEGPAHDLCGAGVAFKLVQALAGLDDAMRYVDLAAIATIADIVPLREENRVIASLGLKKINAHYAVKKGLRMLIESCEIEGDLLASHVGFRIAPKINAVGRIGDASEIVRLFVSDEYIELQGLVDKVTNANELRKSLVSQMYEEALEMLKEADLAVHKVIVLYKESWNIGVLGLVAARLSREYSRPTLLFAGEDVLKGSARAPEGIDLYQTIKASSSVLLGFGGHKGAAGLSVARENLIAARDLMETYLDSVYQEEDFTLRPQCEAEVSADDITIRLAEELSLLEPTGEGNRKPLFKIKSDWCQMGVMGNGAHAKGRLNAQAEIVAFNRAYLQEGIALGLHYDLISECDKEVYKNREKVKLKVSFAVPSAYRRAESNAIAYHRYLRSNVYPETGVAPCTTISFQEIADTLYDDTFGTLFIAFSPETVERFFSNAEMKGKVDRVEYACPVDPARNTLVIAPDFIPIAYKRIILLDTPLTKGYISYLAKHTDAEIYVVKDNYPFRAEIARTDLSFEGIEKTYRAIRSFVFSGNAAASPMEFFEKFPADNIYALISHFYVLYESGSLKVGQGFSLSPQNWTEPSASTIYRRLLALRKQL